jgi:hypothetical protein
MQLYVCAWYRHCWQWLNEPSRRLVETTELYADGLVNPDDFVKAKRAVARTARKEMAESGPDGPGPVGTGLLRQLRFDHPPGWEGKNPSVIYTLATEEDTEEERRLGYRPLTKEEEEERCREPLTKYQIDSLRNLFGNPFRPVIVNPSWLTWNGGTVPKLAQAIYDERRFQDLPVLADALEEAGCTNADMLDHCRLPGEHFRGCWAVDLCLAKS